MALGGQFGGQNGVQVALGGQFEGQVGVQVAVGSAPVVLGGVQVAFGGALLAGFKLFNSFNPKKTRSP